MHMHETGQSGSRQRPTVQARMCDLGLGVARVSTTTTTTIVVLRFSRDPKNPQCFQIAQL